MIRNLYSVLVQYVKKYFSLFCIFDKKLRYNEGFLTFERKHIKYVT